MNIFALRAVWRSGRYLSRDTTHKPLSGEHLHAWLQFTWDGKLLSDTFAVRDLLVLQILMSILKMSGAPSTI